MEVRCICPSCGRACGIGITAAGVEPAAPACAGCELPLPVAEPRAVLPGAPVSRCCICGDDKMYIQRDFDQRIGCLIVAAGAVLVPWTYGLSLGVCALIDYLLYRRLPPLTVCYVCRSRYRGFPTHPDHAPYDLMTAQTWEARSVNWRRLHDRAPAGGRSV